MLSAVRVALLTSLTLIAPALYAQELASSLGAVQGTLVDAASKEPVLDANVWLEPAIPTGIEWTDAAHTEYIMHDPNADKPPAVKTDPAGRFLISKVKPGDYYVAVYAPGFISVREFIPPTGALSTVTPLPPFVKKITLIPGNTADVTVPLQHGGAIEGTIRYADGKPGYDEPAGMSPGLAVDVSIRRPDGIFARALGAAHTDTTGHFRIPDMPAGSYLVFTGTGGGGPVIFYGDTTRATPAKVATVSGTQTTSGVNITLPTTGFHTVSGKLESPDGTPFTSARVTLSPTNETNPLAHLGAGVRSDGSFTFPEVLDDTYTLSAEPEGQIVPVALTPDGTGFRMKIEKLAYTSPKIQIEVHGQNPAPTTLRLTAAAP